MYALALIKLTEAANGGFDLTNVSIANSDQMGDQWVLADGENLLWEDDTLFLKVVSTAVPEPATCAGIFGALALAFAYCRKRK